MLEGALRDVEQARAALLTAITNADTWTDKQRMELDQKRLQPLASEGVKLQAALRKAQEQIARAEQHLRA